MRARFSLVVGAATVGLLTGLCQVPAGAQWDQSSVAGDKGPRWDVRRIATSNKAHPGIDVVHRRVIWLAGYPGEVLRSTDGGRHWRDVSPPRSRKYLFIDVEARGRRHASVFAAGPGTQSRIYTTDNGGRDWSLAFVNRRQKAFYDCMAFWPGGKHGLAVSDPVGGKFQILKTRDGGDSWRVLPDRGMPRALDGEIAFAGSTCIVAAGKRHAWFGTGNEQKAGSRIFHTRDAGRTWTVTRSRIPSAPGSGVFSLAFRKNLRSGVAVGHGASSRTHNRGNRWIPAEPTVGFQSVDWVPGRHRTLVAVSFGGSDISRTGGRHRSNFALKEFNAVSCTKQGACWASGQGFVARLRF